jgi:hypothetical protein
MGHHGPKRLLNLMLMLPLLLVVPAVASAEQIKADLTGYQEVPVVSTNASGEFRAHISPGGHTIDYELSYSGLNGTVQQGHIHVAQLSVNGAIVIWLCQTAAPFLDPTGLAPQCPPSGTVTGTITTANVIGGAPPNPQQLTAGDLAEVIAAIRAGTAYANVHTDLSPGGEIRGQIKASNR